MYSENNIANKRISSESLATVLQGGANSSSYLPYASLFFPYIQDNANIDSYISLTVTRTRRKQTLFGTENEKIDTNHAGHLTNNDFVWGFKETSNQSIQNGNVSNSFAFCGQNLRVYIEPFGTISGLYNGTWCFAKATLKVTTIDLVNGATTVIKTFDDFDMDLAEADRYFDITLPEAVSAMESEYLLSGVYVIALEVSYKLYLDAKLTVESSEQSNIKQRHNLQILLFSCPKEAESVQSPFAIFNASPDESDSFDDLFNKSIFSEQTGIPELSEGQKRAVIADQIAALFVSQHPVATSENYPCRVLGLGAEEKIAPRFVLEKAATYSKRHPEIIPMVQDRMYGMLLSYSTFAFASEIDEYFTNFNQSLQKVRDPSRIISIKETGRVNFDFGTDGILFNPLSIKTINAEIPKEADKESIFNVAIKTRNIEITNFNLTDPDLVSNLSVVTLSPFDNNLLTCPTLNIDTLIGLDPNADSFFVSSKNEALFPSYPYYDEFKVSASGNVPSGGTVYTLLLNPSVSIKFYSGASCYFVIEGRTDDKTWKYRSQGYKLSGTYSLTSYTSLSAEPNPYPSELSVVVRSKGEMNQSLYQYVPFSNDKVKIEFAPVFGENLISRIRYTVWTKEGKAWKEYVDESGLSRSHTFDFSDVGGVGRKSINSQQKPCGIVNAKIDIEDQFGFVNSFWQDYLIPNDNSVPVILSLSAAQSVDGTGSIDIFYNYLGRSEINNSNVQLSYSLDSSSWTVASRYLSGDVGKTVQPGFRKIKWNPWSEIPTTSQSVFVKLSITDIDGTQLVIPSSSVAISIDIRKPVTDVRIVSQIPSDSV